MNEKFKSFFEKIGLFFSAAFLFVLGVLLGNRLQNNGKRAEPDSCGIGDNERNRERAEQSALTVAEIVARVKERGGSPEEESAGL